MKANVSLTDAAEPHSIERNFPSTERRLGGEPRFPGPKPPLPNASRRYSSRMILS